MEVIEQKAGSLKTASDFLHQHLMAEDFWDAVAPKSCPVLGGKRINTHITHIRVERTRCLLTQSPAVKSGVCSYRYERYMWNPVETLEQIKVGLKKSWNSLRIYLINFLDPSPLAFPLAGNVGTVVTFTSLLRTTVRFVSGDNGPCT